MSHFVSTFGGFIESAYINENQCMWAHSVRIFSDIHLIYISQQERERWAHGELIYTWIDGRSVLTQKRKELACNNDISAVKIALKLRT